MATVIADALVYVAAGLVIVAGLIPRKGGMERPVRGHLALASLIASLLSIGVRL